MGLAPEGTSPTVTHPLPAPLQREDTPTMTHTPGGARGRRALPTPADAYTPGMTHTRHPRHRGELVTGPVAQLPDTQPLTVPWDQLLHTTPDGAHGMAVIGGLDTLERWLGGRA